MGLKRRKHAWNSNTKIRINFKKADEIIFISLIYDKKEKSENMFLKTINKNKLQLC